MIVLDASVAVRLISGDSASRDAVRGQALLAPHLIDAEVLHALRGLQLGGRISPDQARTLLGHWQGVSLHRLPMRPLLAEAFGWRHNVSAYDALYVAAAKGNGCPLVTADRRLAAAATDLVDVALML